MRVSILLQIIGDDGAIGPAEEVTAFEKATERPEDLGLSIAEGKAMLAAAQARTVLAQATTWSRRRRCCSACGKRRRGKGSYPLVFRSLYAMSNWTVRAYTAARAKLRTARPRCRRFGTSSPATSLPSGSTWKHAGPRWCPIPRQPGCWPLCCRSRPARTGPPCGNTRCVWRNGQRPSSGTSDLASIDGCQAEWAELPIPEGRIVAALDGGYVRNWDDRKCNFELIVGRSVPEDRAPRYLGLVHGYDQKPSAVCSRC